MLKELIEVEQDSPHTLDQKWHQSWISRLGIVVGLPLIDGVFIALVLTGVLDTVAGIVMTGILVFGGSAAAAIVLTDVAGEQRRRTKEVCLLGIFIVPIAATQAALAPTIAGVIDLELLTYVAAIVLALIGAGLANDGMRNRLPGPWAFVLVGLLVSIRPSGVISMTFDPFLFARGGIAALIGILAVISYVLLGPYVRQWMDVTWVRYGGASSLIALAIAIVTPLTELIAPVVLIAALVMSLFVTRG